MSGLKIILNLEDNMTGQEFYNKYKNKKIIDNTGKVGIVIGYNDDCGIISVCGDGDHFGWTKRHLNSYFYFDDIENELGYWAVTEYSIYKIITFKFGRNERRGIL